MAARALIHPFADPKDPAATALPAGIVRGSGARLYDREGREWVDGFAGLWCVNLGYGRRDLIEAATRQMERAAFLPTFWGQASEPTEALAEALVQVLPGDLRHVMFTNGGSDGNDLALRVLHFIAHAEGRPERRHVLSFEGSYHGTSYAVAGLTGMAGVHAQGEAPFDFQHKIPLNRTVTPGRALDAARIVAETVAGIDAAVLSLGEGRVAALWVEPVLGTVGVWVPPAGWLKAVEAACRRHGIALVLDEVMTGFGRSGTLFGANRDDVRPDMMVMAKGLTSAYVPMGALAMTAAMHEALGQAVASGSTLPMGFTTSGHPVAAAVGLAALAAYEGEAIAPRAEAEGTRMRAMLTDLAGRHDLVGDVRGQGQITAVELFDDVAAARKFAPSPANAIRIRRLAHDHGLICRVFAGEVIAMAPPLTLSPDDTDTIVQRLDATLSQVRDVLRPLA